MVSHDVEREFVNKILHEIKTGSTKNTGYFNKGKRWVVLLACAGTYTIFSVSASEYKSESDLPAYHTLLFSTGYGFKNNDMGAAKQLAINRGLDALRKSDV